MGRKLLGSLGPDFLDTGLIVDAFQVVGMVQVYNKNWNSLVKTEVSWVAHVFKTRPRRPWGPGALWGLIQERQVPTSSSDSWIRGFLGILVHMASLLPLLSGASNLP